MAWIALNSDLLVRNVRLAAIKSVFILFIWLLFPQLGPDLIATIYRILFFSNSKSMPIVDDLRPLYTFSQTNIAKPSNQSPKIVSSAEEIKAFAILSTKSAAVR